MPVKTLSVTTSNSVGVVSYSWAYAQTYGGTPPTGTYSLTNASTASATFNYPAGLTYGGTTQGSNTIGYTFTCTASDAGVAGCSNSTQTVLYFYPTPTCTITLSGVGIS